jgi:AAA ATPase domain
LAASDEPPGFAKDIKPLFREHDFQDWMRAGTPALRGMLRGRSVECAELDRLLEAAHSGQSAVLVLRGEAGIGKTALLSYAAERAEGCRVLRAVGVESEMELPFAGLQQLCAPLLDGLERLPAPQQNALETAFGLSSGTPPDRFFVGLAALGLLSNMSQERPLLCSVDDAQWLDGVSAQVLAFVARRLHAEAVALLFATREASERDALNGLPELRLEGLSNTDAQELLLSVIAGRLDEPVADRIVAETRGNPLALLEPPRRSTPDELAGGFGLPATLPGRIEESFRQRAEWLPANTRSLLLLAAAEPVGEPALLWRASARLGIDSEAAAPAEADGLLKLGPQVRFRHPLVRSAIYRAASPEERRRVHDALAEATDPNVDPDRRAWHRAQATLAPDEVVAAELEHSAGRAQARGGLAAAAAFLEQAALLTPEPTPGRSVPWRRRRPSTRPARRTPRSDCWPGRKRDRWTRSATRAWICCAGKSRSPSAVAEMRLRSCSRRPRHSSR